MNEPTVTITGNVAAPAKLRYTPGDKIPVTDLRLAVNIRRQQGDQWITTSTLWYEVTVWRALAQTVATSVRVGDRLTVIGRATDVHTYADGHGEIQATTKVTAESVTTALEQRSTESATTF
ncbi:single-stranded DNA-binding protein [Kineosporia rhizophila]|uniref:single-stranded DNA-binding protein n=1 Tax=Kineosporia rhizophila TaxID=84633 RepID=UPI000AA7252E|nr:single-stranded DNA-binding protein [Kineosporia rhizophila]MCE0536617.1 single-stranded DNA-binding protein [Kineosporia rhizophila]